MKVGFFSDSAEMWGAEKSLLYIATGLGRIGDIEVTGFFGPKSPMVREFSERGLGSEAVRFSLRSRASGGPWRNVSMVVDLVGGLFGGIRLAPVVRRLDVAVVFSAWQLPELMVAGWLARRPVVLDLHETYRPGPRRRLLAIASQHVRGVIAPSHHVMAANGVSSDAGVVVPRPVTAGPFARRPRQDRVRVGIVGQVAPHKRVLELAQNINWVAINAELLIVGAHPDSAGEDGYAAQVRALSDASSGWITLVPRLETVGEVMAALDYVVNCSEHEAFGRTMVEAAAWGAFPVAVGHGGGPAEVVRDLGFGAVVDDFGELERLLSNDPASAFSGEQLAGVAQRVRAGYSPDALVPHIAAYLKQVARWS